MPVSCSKEFCSYNPRRYGRPWVARITAFNGAPTLQFIDRAYNGSDAGGELVFDADVGEIVKIGQKDNRSSSSSNYFYRVLKNGELELINNAIDARKAWMAWKDGIKNGE